MNQHLQMFLAIQQYQYRQQRVMGQQSHQLNPATAAASMLANMAGGHHISPGQLGVSAMKRVVPVISAYTRLPMMSQRHRFQSSAT
jgi:hypothetical protein